MNEAAPWQFQTKRDIFMRERGISAPSWSFLHSFSVRYDPFLAKFI